jgi:hypothetical protein
MSGRRKAFCVVGLLGLWLSATTLIYGNPMPSNHPAASGQASSKASADQKPFYLHAFHVKQLGLDCSTCHVPVKDGSVVLKRPGHDQCMVCHQDDFGAKLNPKLCAQCHTQFPPTGNDLYPFPRYQNKRPIVFEFSHALHVDPQARVDSHTGFRSDCTFCHQLNAQGVEEFPGHTQCAACHSKAGMKPLLSADSTTADCLGCHLPEAIENPNYIKGRVIPSQVASGKYGNINFNHTVHFRFREQLQLQCTTCHSAILRSTSLETLQLPKMITCAQCHDAAHTVPVQFRMNDCQSCHLDGKSGLVKPAYHTGNFRLNHAKMAAAPGANCYVCHTNLRPSETGSKQCLSCHEVMRPQSHTVQWKEDIHGKYAAIDRETCATCHVADFCINCHNQLPRSHVPLGPFENGGHANLAMLNERSCLTCHTVQNTCSRCHASNLQK